MKILTRTSFPPVKTPSDARSFLSIDRPQQSLARRVYLSFFMFLLFFAARPALLPTDRCAYNTDQS